MLCETHKDILYKSVVRGLALVGAALLGLGASFARPATWPHSVAGAHGVAAPAYRSVEKGRQPQPAARSLGISNARATISLYEHSVRRRTLREQGCEAAKRGVGGIVILDFGQPAYNGHTYGTYLFSGAFAGNAKITGAMLAYAVGY